MKARSLGLSLVGMGVSVAMAVVVDAPAAYARPLPLTSVMAAEGAPTDVGARPLHGAIRVSWHPPASSSARTPVSYVATATGGAQATAAASAHAVTVTGLADGWWHAVTVTAVYDDGSRVTSLRSIPVATPVLAGWSTKVTGGRTHAILTDAVRVRPAGAWTLQVERRRLGATTWISDAKVTTGADGTGRVPLRLLGGSWQWRLAVVGPAADPTAHSTVVRSAARGIVASSHPCVWASTGILRAPAKSGTGKRIVWDKSASQVWLVGQGGTVRCSYAVTDNDDDTPVGSYQVRSKSAMSSAVTDGRFWRLAHMVRFYLQPGHHLWIGFHAVPQAPNGQLIQPLASLGKPGYKSHGCVRQHPTNAENLFAFAKVGTKVVVIA